MSDIQNKPITKETAEDDRQHQMITGMLMALEAMLSSAVNKVKSIKEFINSPLGNISNANNSILQSIRNIKVQLITSFARQNKSHLNFVAYSHDDAATHIFICLNSDTEEIRNVFYAFLDSYEEHQISTIYPMVFHFITKDMLDLITDPNIIILDEQASKSM